MPPEETIGFKVINLYYLTDTSGTNVRGKTGRSTQKELADTHLLLGCDVNGQDRVAATGIIVHVVPSHRTVPHAWHTLQSCV